MPVVDKNKFHVLLHSFICIYFIVELLFAEIRIFFILSFFLPFWCVRSTYRNVQICLLRALDHFIVILHTVLHNNMHFIHSLIFILWIIFYFNKLICVCRHQKPYAAGDTKIKVRLAHGCIRALNKMIMFNISKAKCVLGELKTKQNSKFSSVPFKLASQIIKISLVLCIQIYRTCFKRFTFKFCTQVLWLFLFKRRREEKNDYYTIVGMLLSSLSTTIINNKKENLALLLWFFVGTIRHQFCDIFRKQKKKKENETNYKMLEEVFYLLRNVIVRNSV